MTWLRFNYDYKGNKKHDVVWVEDEAEANRIADDKHKWASRCVNPDGVSFEEAAPEDVLEFKRKYKEYRTKEKAIKEKLEKDLAKDKTK